MFCQNCGAKLDGGAVKFCPECGTAVVKPENQAGQPGYTQQVNVPSLIGFSPRISDPAFAAYRRKSVAWAFIFTGILAVIATVAFPIYGSASGDIDWPWSLFYGMGIGTMFILIAGLQTLKGKLDKTWDGTVIYKNTYQEVYRGRHTHSYRTVFIIKVQKDSGGVKKHKWRDIPGVYDYYAVGDRVRHHKGFHYYEKYDKSRDAKIMCAACNSFIDTGKDICPRCKCPLLK